MKIGFIGIIIRNDRCIAEKVNALLADYGRIITGRIGVPNHSDSVFVIGIIVKGENEVISALTGKLGKLENVKVKSAVTDTEV